MIPRFGVATRAVTMRQHSSGTQQPVAPSAQNSSASTGVQNLEAGVYYKRPGRWVKLEQATMAAGEVKYVGKMFVPGLNPQIAWTFRGAKAPVQIPDPRPAFYVKQPLVIANVPGSSKRDLVIVRFDKKKRRRELQTSAGDNRLTFKIDFSKERTPDITVTQVSESVFLVVPSESLPAGEYLLSFGGSGFSGYEFGIKVGR